MRFRLAERGGDAAVVTLGARVTFDDRPLRLTYPTRTGALLRIDGTIVGAFDGKHRTIDLPPYPGEREVELVVERRSLPVSGLPGHPIMARFIEARAAQRPPTALRVRARAEEYGGLPRANGTGGVPLVGHAHLDVAWLWTYAQTRRKAQRTFATALRQLELDDRYVYAQSQPQLYAWVESDAPELLARVRSHIGRGWDASVASMWVEPDLHASSGESILRQFAFAAQYVADRFGQRPDVVWLPDTFGFPSTLPTLGVHAGMYAFVTSKLQWNETTRWPHPQFFWYGDDGSYLVAAVIERYDGRIDARRKAIARERDELLVHGYGDGGGGAPDADLRGEPRDTRPWTNVGAWCRTVGERVLPAHRGELYLETHRGTYTTHRDVKARNAALERALGEAEELCAWCIAIGAPRSAVQPLRDDLRTAWMLVLRQQFHDVLAGTSIAAAYADVAAEHERAERIVARVAEAARSILPRANVRLEPAAPVAPRDDDGTWWFENAYVRARVRPDGTIVELSGADGRNVVALANGLALYVDRPRAWDAWNLDASYQRRRAVLRPRGSRIEEDGLVVQLAGPRVAVTMRIALHADEAYLRVELAVAWQTDHRVLRAEHRLAVRTDEVRFGQPHGSLVRRVAPVEIEQRVRFEVPAQRWVHASDGAAGLALLAADTYGWNARALPDGAVLIGSSLLRAPCWPDPTADRGERRIAYALAPTAGATAGALELAWSEYAEPARVRLFTCDDPAVLIVATKPADDGEGIVVRVRECDGAPRQVRLRCGARMRRVQAVDACERTVAGEAAIDGETLSFVLAAHALRSFRILP